MGRKATSGVVVGRARGAELTVVFGNVQSAINKMNEFRAMMCMMKPDVIALTETWTHDEIGAELLEVEGYEVVARSDRNDTEKGRGGGILIYVNKRINARRIEENRSFNQSASIEVKKWMRRRPNTCDL